MVEEFQEEMLDESNAGLLWWKFNPSRERCRGGSSTGVSGSTSWCSLSLRVHTWESWSIWASHGLVLCRYQVDWLT